MLRHDLDDDLALQLAVRLLVRAASRDVAAILRRERSDPLDCVVELDDLELDLRVAYQLAVVRSAGGDLTGRWLARYDGAVSASLLFANRERLPTPAPASDRERLRHSYRAPSTVSLLMQQRFRARRLAQPAAVQVRPARHLQTTAAVVRLPYG
jgi:hypothetical protein